MGEFKTQFQPAMMEVGPMHINQRDGGKHYVACFVAYRRIAHQSKAAHRTATDAKVYGKEVLFRYRRLMEAAFLTWLEAQEIPDAQTS